LPRSHVFPDEGTTLAFVVRMAVDHTAHHRGALAQYARLLKRATPFPYHDQLNNNTLEGTNNTLAFE